MTQCNIKLPMTQCNIKLPMTQEDRLFGWQSRGILKVTVFLLDSQAGNVHNKR